MATDKPWHLMQGGQLLEQPVAPTLISCDEVLELQAVLAGMVLGKLAGTRCAPLSAWPSNGCPTAPSLC